jgi:hypothetical protein
MNWTNFTCPTSLPPYVHEWATAFSDTWRSSLELRVAVFVLVLQLAFLLWATVLAREVSVATTTVLCKLLVYGCEASCAASNRTGGTSAPPLAHGTRHKTGGGPPPGLPPGQGRDG